jgi:flagellar hook-associated protein 3 FlgL
MTRIGSFAASQFTLQKNLAAETRAGELRIQIASGKKSQTYSGIAGDARRLEGAETTHAANKSFLRSIERTDLRLKQMEAAVSGLQDIATRFRTDLLSAANGDNADSFDLGAIASRLRNEVQALVNTDLDGRFLFAGSATHTRPVDFSNGAGGTLTFAQIQAGQYYRGNSDTLTVRADEGLTVDYGLTADPNQKNGFHALITALSEVIASPPSDTVIDSAIANLSGQNGAISRLADSRAQIGSTRELLGTVRERLSDSQVDVANEISSIEDVDLTKAATELSEQQTTLESSFAVTARLARTSLLNFIT